MNQHQPSMCHRLRKVISSWLKAASGSAADLHRSLDKYSNIQLSEDKLSHIASLSSQLFRDLRPYETSSKIGRPGACGTTAGETSPVIAANGLNNTKMPLQGSSGLSIKADRLKFDGPPCFRAVKFYRTRS